MTKIPVYQPDITGNEKKYVLDALESTWISSKGKYIDRFENEISNFLGVDHVTSVSNGTVALHVALLALGIGEGDEVIVPSFTYIASVNTIVETGAKPVFVDSLADTWQIDPKDVEKKITPKTKAIMAVHLYGHPCDMDELQAIAKKNSCFIIEDAAESFGSEYKGIKTGNLSDIATFSFFGNKTITTGEGGAVVTNNLELIEKVRCLKNQGICKDKEYWHTQRAYNYRMTNLQAAIGCAQLEKLNSFLQKKQEIARFYQESLKDLPLEVHRPKGNVYHSYWMVSILVNDAKAREELRSYLSAKKIETRPHFYPAHTMPMYEYLAEYSDFPVANDLAARGINLPSWPGLTIEQLNYIAKSINEYFKY